MKLTQALYKTSVFFSKMSITNNKTNEPTDKRRKISNTCEILKKLFDVSKKYEPTFRKKSLCCVDFVSAFEPFLL